MSAMSVTEVVVSRPEVVDVQVLVGVLDDVLDGVDALGDVHVRLFLPPVAEDLKLGRIRIQLLDEVGDHVAALVGADDVRESGTPDWTPYEWACVEISASSASLEEP